MYYVQDNETFIWLQVEVERQTQALDIDGEVREGDYVAVVTAEVCKENTATQTCSPQDKRFHWVYRLGL